MTKKNLPKQKNLTLKENIELIDYYDSRKSHRATIKAFKLVKQLNNGLLNV